VFQKFVEIKVIVEVPRKTAKMSENQSINMRGVILTGMPGVGKSTVIKKVCELAKSKKYVPRGFWTTEIRKHDERIGFDFISLSDGKFIIS